MKLRNPIDIIRFALSIENSPKAFGRSDLSAKDIRELMSDQIGSGWVDRIFSTRSNLRPDKVEAIMNAASSRAAGRLGPLYELYYYCETDARIGGLIDKRVGAVTRALHEVTPGNKDNPDSVDAARFISKYLEDIRFKNFIKAAMDGRKYGVTAFQNIVETDGNMYFFRDPSNESQISQSRWWQGRSSDDNWGKLYLKSEDLKNDLYIDNHSDIHPARLSVFTNTRKRGYYDMTGFMNRVLKLYVAKIWTLTFLMQSIEQYGRPFIWTVLPEDKFKSPRFKSTVSSVLRQFSGSRWGVFPEGFDLEHLDASSGTGNALHFDWLEYINTELAVAIVGQNLSTEVTGGSFAAATTHASVEERIVEEDIEWIQEQMNDNFIFWLIKMNWPDMDREDYPILKLSPVKNIDMERIARGFKSATELIDVPVEEIRAQLQIRAPRKSEDEEGYDEEVIGPSTTRRRRDADQLLRGLTGRGIDE